MTYSAVFSLLDRGLVMRRLSEIQERGIRRRLAMLIQRGRERESLSRQWQVPWQGQDNPRGFDALQQAGSDSSHLEIFWFLGRKVVIERKRQPGFTRVSQTLNQLSNMADHPDALELSAGEVRALQ
jgi:hypothetical protein